MYLSPVKLKRFRINRNASNTVRPQKGFHFVFDRPHKAIENVLACSIKINQKVTGTCHFRLAINELVGFSFLRSNAWSNTDRAVAITLGFLKTFYFTRPNLNDTSLFSNVSLWERLQKPPAFKKICFRKPRLLPVLVWAQSKNELQRTRFQAKTP